MQDNSTDSNTPSVEELERIERLARSVLPSVEVKNLPSVVDQDIPYAALGVLAMTAAGLPHSAVAKLLNCSIKNVEYYLRKYDPEREFRMEPEMVRDLTLTRIRAKRLLLETSLTPQLIEDMSGKEITSAMVDLARVEYYSKPPEEKEDRRSSGAKLIEEIRSELPELDGIEESGTQEETA